MKIIVKKGPKACSIKLEKAVIIICYILFNAFNSYSQTNSSTDGNWDTGSNWTNGVPSKDEVVIISNNMTLDTDLEINDGGSYTLSSGSIIDAVGGDDFKIKVKGTGYLEVSGNISLEGELKVEDDGELIVRACDTLRVGGKLEFKDDAKLTLEDCAVIFVGKDLKFKDDVVATVHGNISVDGKVESKDDAIVSGTGVIESDDKTDIKDNSTIFGSSSGCDPGPCQYGSGAPLPITLGIFQGEFISQNSIEVKWETYAEINNDFFTLLYSVDGYDYKVAKIVLGAGNSNKKLLYKALLNDLTNETIYLKLKQTDFDGKYKEFNPITVRNTSYTREAVSEELTLYPNPGDGNTLFMEVKGLAVSNYNVSIYNNAGRIVLNKSIQIDEGSNYQRIELLSGGTLKKGLYFIQFSSSSKKIIKKYIVN